MWHCSATLSNIHAAMTLHCLRHAHTVDQLLTRTNLRLAQRYPAASANIPISILPQDKHLPLAPGNADSVVPLVIPSATTAGRNALDDVEHQGEGDHGDDEVEEPCAQRTAQSGANTPLLKGEGTASEHMGEMQTEPTPSQACYVFCAPSSALANLNRHPAAWHPQLHEDAQRPSSAGLRMLVDDEEWLASGQPVVKAVDVTGKGTGFDAFCPTRARKTGSARTAAKASLRS